ncbi:AraC family transcriptional regulator [Alkaliphilus crotonatoxidans]
MITDICFPKPNINEIYEHYELELSLIDKVVNGEVKEALGLFDELFDNRHLYALDERCAFRSQKNHLISLSALLCHNVIKKGVPPYTAKAKNQSFVKLIENAGTMATLMNLGRILIRGYCTQVTSRLTRASDAHIIKAINYIHNNLGEDLTLERVAEHVNLSRCYFCTQFKKETRLSFSNYLAHARIEKSKFLLTHSDKSILDIAILLGFNSQNYFTTQFKKFTGMTPKKFRIAGSAQKKDQAPGQLP